MTPSAHSVVYFLDYALDPADARLTQGARAVALRPKTLAVLTHLAANPQRLVTKEELLDTVWSDTAVTDWVLTSCIRELRDALGDDAREPRIIETVRGRGYRFIAPVRSAPSAATGPTLGTALVGRESDVERLDECCRAAVGGERQIVFVIGEAGMGKTALVEEFLQRLRQSTSSSLLIAHGQCIEQHGEGEPYLPILEALERLCTRPHGVALVELLRRHAPSWLLQLPGLLEPAECEALERRLGAASRERMLREIAAVVTALPEPLVLLLEDLHWSDHATLDAVSALAQRRDAARLMLIGTYRPIEVTVRSHALRKLHQDLRDHGRCRDMWLAPLTESGVATYLQARWPDLTGATALASVLHERTDGNPLFLINIADYLAADGAIVEVDGRWMLQGNAAAVAAGIPPGLRQLIAAHIERLDDADRTALEAGSFVGRRFSAALVAAALAADTMDIEERLARLARKGLMIAADGSSDWPDGTVAGAYRFDHSLYQSVLRDGVPPTRGRSLHERIAARLEQAWAGRVADVSTELASHLEASGQAERAVPHLEEGAARAMRRGAAHEASIVLERALAILDRLPRTPERMLRTIRLSLTLGSSFEPGRGGGAAAAEQAYDRARRLSEDLDDPVQLFQALTGLTGTYVSQARLDRAHETAGRLEALLGGFPLPPFVFAGSLLIGMVHYHGGGLAEARELFERAVSLDDVPLPPLAIDLRVMALTYLALTLIHQGHPDQGRARLRQAIDRAALGRPFDQSFAAQAACHIYTLLRDVSALATAADEAAALEDFPTMAAVGRFNRGRVLGARGDHAPGIRTMRDALDTYRAIGQRIALPLLIAALAESHAAAGDSEAAFACLAEARTTAESAGEVRYLAELHRLEGELHAGADDRSTAERCYRTAIDRAHAQGERWWELRATTSSAALALRPRTPVATRRARRDELATVVASFSEGLDTVDVREAKRVLAELG
jgi:DNA-binding winged helix-turn-helix (wHTH) protein/tetratricopeptide (TPR) repeat protein